MTTGDKMKNADTAFRALRPAALDDLADEAHGRRRDADLARAMSAAADPRPRSRPRRPVLLVAGAAVAACAVAGAIVLPGGDEQAPPPATAQGPVDARAFLLASAKTAEKAPGEAGRYWYTRMQEQRVLDHRTGGSGKNRPAEKLPYKYRLTTGQESWTARDADDPSRTITGIDVRTGFPTKQDEAAWKRAGSEPLVTPEQRRRSVNDYDIPIRYTIGDAQLTMAELRRLPADAGGLEAELRRRYEADRRSHETEQRGGSAEDVGTFAQYVFGTAHDLLAGPITPGTKAALYRVLAKQPETKAEGRTTDPLGRSGVAVSFGFAGGEKAELIIAPDTAELLAYRSGGLSITYQETGWVSALGARS